MFKMLPIVLLYINNIYIFLLLCFSKLTKFYKRISLFKKTAANIRHFEYYFYIYIFKD